MLKKIRKIILIITGLCCFQLYGSDLGDLYPLNTVVEFLKVDYGYDPFFSVISLKEGTKRVRLIPESPYISIGHETVFVNSFVQTENGSYFLTKDTALLIMRYFQPDNKKFSLRDGNIFSDTTDIQYSITKQTLDKKDITATHEVIEQDKIDSYSEIPDATGNSDSGVVLSRDKSLIKAIIIDPGHGGNDPGAVGYNGIMEKDVVLRTALILSERIKKKYPDKKIILTRDRDVFIPLEQRSKIANFVYDKYGSSLFISIHVNASFSSKAYGFETWYLVKEYTRDLAKNIKSSDKDVLSIINLMLNDEIYKGSKDLAQFIQDGLNTNIGDISRNRGIKEEKYFVIKNSVMPAVLVEIGFNTNKDEGIRLTKYAYLNKITDGILAGIDKFLITYENSNGQ